MSSESIYCVTEAATGMLTNVASSVSQGVSYVSSASSGIGDVVHHISSGVKRLVTSPPEEAEELPDENIEIPTTPVKHSAPTSIKSDSSNISEPTSLIASVDEELGLSENYFRLPEVYDVTACTNHDEIRTAIDKCKQLILRCDESSERRRVLVHRLIQLRLCHEQIKEDQECASLGILVAKGHQMHPVLSRAERSTKQNCDRCTHIIWGVLHLMYRCSLCEFQCHRKCLKVIQRKCSSIRFSERPNYIFKIAPEIGLAAQNFRCAECNRLLNNKSAWSEPQLCDYTGRYFCPACHWNATAVIPARVVHNWDFEPYPVSQQSSQLLKFMNAKPLIHLEHLNPHLFLLVHDLSLIKATREDLIVMKAYLCTCRVAQQTRLLRLLDEHQHFVEEPHCYSMKDLIAIHTGTILAFLQQAHAKFLVHIKETCVICKGKGFICELCGDEAIIYPFDASVTSCQVCQSCFHARCFLDTQCPKCARQKSRSSASPGPLN